MFRIVLAVPLALTLSAAPALSANVVIVPQDADVSHSGGCRKDSPQGQCCHAGSKPYHCH